MRPEERDSALLWTMLKAAREVAFFVQKKTWDDYQKDLLLRRAVERSVEVVGEAARKVSKSFKDGHAEIPWPKIVGQRHRIAHEYETIDDSTIWKVATVHIPVLIEQLEILGIDSCDDEKS
ncbi:MAG: DUF86 domain-containing protein [Planctomycetes bacterium]|nr:DUF86 domain-containing protein [Planctomycetota bacterium]